MSPSTDNDQDEDDDLDPEGPDRSEMDYSDAPDLEVCADCRKMISEEAQRCPHCGQFVSSDDAPLSRVAWAIIGIIVLVLLGLIFSRVF